MTGRRAIITAMLAGVALIVGPPWSGHQPRYIWNASASAPIGLYRIAPADGIEVTDLVVVLPPEPLATFLDERGYLPRGAPLLKRVLALSGTKVCREDAEITAYDTTYGTARERDSRGRRLPVWQGCGTVAADEAFLMNWKTADSLDGRYFGPLPLSSIVGRAVPVWTFETPAEPAAHGRFRMRTMLVRRKRTLPPPPTGVAPCPGSAPSRATTTASSATSAR